MTSLVDKLFTLNAVLVYVVVALLVFAEDALFVGFVLPGETAAVLGGVIATQGKVHLWLMIALVVAAAIIGDTVGYEIGRHLGPRILAMRILDKRRRRLDDAQGFLRRRGGWAVFLGRFVAFFRAVMPALAGTSRMPYRRFLAFNAAGGLVWGNRIRGAWVRHWQLLQGGREVGRARGRTGGTRPCAGRARGVAYPRPPRRNRPRKRAASTRATRPRTWH